MRTTITVSRLFDYCRNTLANGDHVDDVAYGGYMPLNGGGGTNGRPLGKQIGRIHNRAADGVWYATPDSGDWDSLQWFGPFWSRREAAMFLTAMYLARLS
jgi:hypothetical protein